MSNIEKIRQKIEMLMKETEDSQFDKVKRYGLKTVLEFINFLPEEKLSDGLEEAADEYADDNFEQWVEDDEIYSDSDKIRETFIAGAKWMSKQINNE